MNAVALAKTVKALEDAGVLTEAHSALVAALEDMAELLDDFDSDARTNASLWKVYTATLTDLISLVAHDSDDKQNVLAAMQAALRN